MFLVKKSAINALSDVAVLQERVTVSVTYVADLLAYASASSRQIARATVELR